ncbi:MAG: septum formation inhibitor Maf [Peptococcaceae bacterium BRH_c8a]|nr:MAG: septum formation inhibitor Maf [Peptococcaceae bacterium BRH_c8a]
MPHIYLASSSPRRREILELIKLPHTVLAIDVDETLPPGMTAPEQVESLSRRKADYAARQLPGGVVIAADTVVVLDGEVLGKPEDETMAMDMLERLQGHTHEVFTGATVWDISGGRFVTGHDHTFVDMRPVGRDELLRYIATGEPMDKAGAYGIQGLGSVFITGIRGCYFNVMGLPVYKLTRMLKELDIDVSEHWG